MFTGLVQSMGQISAVEPRAEGKTLTIAARLSEAERMLGASVAVNGVCLTVTKADEASFTVDAAFETLAKTTLGQLESGARVNLEPAMRIGDAIGGHLVSGHVDGVGRFESATPRGEARECWFSVPSELAGFIAIKGSVCVEGVSLTINAVEGTGTGNDDPARFMVGLIPHTLEVTTLGSLRPGVGVNIEVDQLARYVARLLEVERARGSETA